ncbi:hypothetical protein Ahy_A04g017841 isoform C [Arachis hypogaea]|uniref:Uncharacterized protein n=1 Tax=Arachis hypogaea TaxID=3818 RepID=A0A445DC70_ARAHY|nr:hypothetical protein Ahy_A04g017841 isoform C [Arachis hypogaea]
MERRMKVDVNPFGANASFIEPCFGVNMVGMSYDFDVALDDFESQFRYRCLMDSELSGVPGERCRGIHVRAEENIVIVCLTQPRKTQLSHA